MGIEDLEKFLPVVLINRNYVVTSLNDTGKMMLGEVVGKKCFQVLYNLDKPCPEYNISCPILSGEENVDTVTLDFEVYLRTYGKLPIGGIYWESVINITNLSIIRSGVFDALTGLYSRSFLSGMIDKFFYMWKRYGEVFSVLFIDMDNLKQINDEYGHLTGDEALKKVGQCIKLYLRKADIGVRYGGDEFIVVLPKTRREEAIKVAKRIRECISSIPFVTKLSASLGVIESSEKDTKVEEMIERADKVLYYAKSVGEGTIAVAKTEEEFYTVD
ncbi:diguanylate cyclase (GGDEF)-like protein [Hydrogenivirga caldilitoris]|uniref:diguanylate cyclase n=1 Tax=Hydrogenivirga caldilitoris TaxID=246264 RepID=A0A497XRM5_9AQUI|nr:GGDEF domain-containing protein [Hydrogenivirga caldilitoris]RLJ71606.1 diguanylate cyclase (GGDEF)-like protein [Hydrogenivirga caldilitoris]